MVNMYDEPREQATKQVICQECSTLLGGEGQPDIYKHMLHCLNVEQGAVSRIKNQAIANGNENGRRVAYLCDAILGGE